MSSQSPSQQDSPNPPHFHQSQSSARSQLITQKKVFVGGLRPEATRHNLSEYFGKYGIVKEAVVIMDHMTDKSRGFGFVTFETLEAAEKALSSKNEILGKWVDVKHAERKDTSLDPTRYGFDSKAPRGNHGQVIAAHSSQRTFENAGLPGTTGVRMNGGPGRTNPHTSPGLSHAPLASKAPLLVDTTSSGISGASNSSSVDGNVEGFSGPSQPVPGGYYSPGGSFFGGYPNQYVGNPVRMMPGPYQMGSFYGPNISYNGYVMNGGAMSPAAPGYPQPLPSMGGGYGGPVVLSPYYGNGPHIVSPSQGQNHSPTAAGQAGSSPMPQPMYLHQGNLGHLSPANMHSNMMPMPPLYRPDGIPAEVEPATIILSQSQAPQESEETGAAPTRRQEAQLLLAGVKYPSSVVGLASSQTLRQVSSQAGKEAKFCWCGNQVVGRLGNLRLSCRCLVHYDCILEYVQSKLGACTTEMKEERGIVCPFASAGECKFSTSLQRRRRQRTVAAAAAAAASTASTAADVTEPSVPDEAVTPLKEGGGGGSEEVPSGSPRAERPDERLYFLNVPDLQRLCDYGRFLISVNAHSKDLEPLTQENVQMFVEWCEQHSDWWRTRGQKPSGAAEDDPLKVAQTKPCPGCGTRAGAHFHGHSCHHIWEGCSSCGVKYCYACSSTSEENIRERQFESVCKCPSQCWSDGCKILARPQDIAQFLALEPYPHDTRCGCPICPECRSGSPCDFCDGDCMVCLGILNPGPMEANAPWVPQSGPEQGAQGIAYADELDDDDDDSHSWDAASIASSASNVLPVSPSNAFPAQQGHFYGAPQVIMAPSPMYMQSHMGVPPVPLSPPPSAPQTMSPSPSPGRRVCYSFQRGSCRFGSACRYAHFL